jgi:NTE family protein
MFRAALLFIFILTTVQAQAQKVGLVLSGGGVKGIAHVGVLKALEENEIPIDYIVGTSMGGIIGGCYAAGMSPAEIETMILSDDFIRWVNGLPEKGVNYNYTRDEDGHYFFKVNLSLDSTFSFQFNSSLANDVSLNFELGHYTAQGEAIAKQNFDSLFVPLRVVAADVFTQSEVILSKGSLSESLRATQSVPFFYTPIRVDGKYLFDGGVYNNFPVDIAQKNFAPDILIGSNVSSKVFKDYPYKNDDKLINSSLLYMFLDKSDPEAIPPSGVYIQPNLQDYSALNFDNARELIDSGYRQTLRQLEELKTKVTTRRTVSEVALARSQFISKRSPWEFNRITFNGYNSRQRKYIRRIFKIDTKKENILDYTDIKRGYYKLMAEPYFTNAYPTMPFDTLTQKFIFKLTRRPQKNFQVEFGGILATRDISNIALGLNYYYFNRFLTHAFVGVQTGSFYKSAVVRTRIDLPYLNQYYIQPEFIFNQWDYLESEDLLEQVEATVLKRFDRKIGIDIGKAIGSSFKGVINVDGFYNKDEFSNKNSFTTTDTLDVLTLRGFKTGITLSMNTLNRKQYPSAGKAISLSAQYYKVEEDYTPGNTGNALATAITNNHEWFRAKLSAEFYYNKGWFRPGFFAEGVVSNQPSFGNYYATLINSPAFFPLQDSRTLILKNFRSVNYAATGLRTVFSLRKSLDFRLEGYIFKPFDYFIPGQNNEPVKQNELSKIYVAATSSLVFHTPVGPIALNVNYYDNERNKYGVFLHVGYLLFQKHSME